MNSVGRKPQPRKLSSLQDLMVQFDVRLLIARVSHLEGFEEFFLGARPFGMQLSESGTPASKPSA